MTLKFIIIPLVVGVAAQLVKLATDDKKNNISFKDMLFSYGGFPSVHTSFVTSLSTIIGLKEGISSPLFAVTVTLGILTIRDALGLRNTIYAHAKYLDKLSTELNHKPLIKLPQFNGHTVPEICAGIAFGIVLTLLLSRYPG